MSTETPAEVAEAGAPQVDREFEAELRQAVADIDAGRCFTLTPEMAEQWATTGTCPGLDEWLAESET
jgi:hypothetical protein